ncbi:hypothetical protein BJF93_11790 [Xaviernesmea oryzae]|uniref:Solute-binding protein family 3/N-terminal domain-containing protein n=1 Tax=Xaviernesmea oryzae TaxID=464029 RepID=A0A1Q9AVK4_9HYPH|nr:hypothetical protein BJF93_11790 [Xaviernesmea oryzae]
MCFSLLSATVAKADPGDGPPLRLLTENYAPFNFEEAGALTGVSVEQLKIMLSEAHIAFSMEMLPWARAYGLAARSPSTCIFSTMLTPQRHDLFKWVAPLYHETQMLARRRGPEPVPASLEEARKLTVGVYIDDVAADLARAQKFDHIDTSPSLESSLEKLLAGRVDLIYIGRSTLDRLQAEGQPIEPALAAYRAAGGLACNLQTPDATIAALQQALDRMIADGRQAALFKRFGIRSDP